MKRHLIVAISLSVSLAGVPGGVLAQPAAPPVISGNVIGECGAGAGAGDSTITCGDLNRVPGMTVITPAGVETRPVPVDVGPAPEPAPDAEPVPIDEPPPVDEPVAETTVDAGEANTAVGPDTAVASETDLDADNYPDALELEVGLDPTNVDTDGDGVSDGGELFDRRSDPLVWNDAAAASPNAVLEEGTAEGGAPAGAEDVAARTASLDSDADRLADADEDSFGTDATSPDSDGDGYYDGDEVNLNTDPLDPASVPAT
jgi:hypothetical protein